MLWSAGGWAISGLLGGSSVSILTLAWAMAMSQAYISRTQPAPRKAEEELNETTPLFHPFLTKYLVGINV